LPNTSSFNTFPFDLQQLSSPPLLDCLAFIPSLPLLLITTHDHWKKIKSNGFSSKKLSHGFQICNILKKNIIFGGKKNLVEFTLNIKYNKNPHENIF
jgi:hypothetical protein